MGSQSPRHTPPRIATFRELRGYLREDRAANRGSFWNPSFQAIAVYRLGVWRNSIGFRPLRMLVTLVYTPLAWIVYALYNIELTPRTRVGRRLVLPHHHGIVIHPRTVIGDDCRILQGATIGAAGSRNDGMPVLGNGVEVAAGAVVVGAVTIGDGARIGPNAVVMTNVPAGSIVATPPPRIMTPPPRRKPAAAAAAAPVADGAADGAAAKDPDPAPAPTVPAHRAAAS